MKFLINRCFVRLFVAVAILLASSFSVVHAADPPIRRELHDVPLERVSIEGGFWGPRRQVWQAVTIRDCLAKFERDGVLENFERVIRGESGGHRGAPWFDGLTYEMIAGASDFLAVSADEELRSRLLRYADLISQAAERDPNCYLNTYTQLMEPDHRWGRNGGNLRFQHDVYNVGCMIEAAVHLYRATGDTKLLSVATRLATHMADTMGPAPKWNVIPGHALPEESLVKLYKLYAQQPQLKQSISADVDESKFLSLAKFFVEARGYHEGRESLGQYAQDDRPMLTQTAIAGHAVRATLLCSGMCAIAAETKDADYFAATWRLWNNMTERRMYVTGGVGAVAHDEKFGSDYELPNDGYLEICAAVSSGFFHQRMHLLTGDSRFTDELERVVYNGVLSGVSLAGDRYLYENPLTSAAAKERWSWHGCPCCPPMFLKIMGALPGYIYSESSEAAYVNLFVQSQADLNVAGTTVTLTQQTDYPFDEQVKLQIAVDTPTQFALKIRMPYWCDKPEIAVNGNLIDAPVVEHGYAVIERQWRSDDTVAVRLPMPIREMQSHPAVAANVGRVAVCRGPLVYCAEECDLAAPLTSIYLPANSTMHVERNAELLDGITTIVCEARTRTATGDFNDLYRNNDLGFQDPLVRLTAIPFFAHSNRGRTAHMVWIPNTPALTQPRQPPTIASAAKWTASHCWTSDTIEAVNDQLPVSRSDDESIPRFTWWDHRGSKEWLQCDLSSEDEVSELRVFWWDERRVGRHCRVPSRWRVLTEQNGEWLPIEGQTEGGTVLDSFNSVTFPPQRLKSLRIEVELQPDWSAGVLEVEIGG